MLPPVTHPHPHPLPSREREKNQWRQYFSGNLRTSQKEGKPGILGYDTESSLDEFIKKCYF
jgi:hypothetical protein